MAFELSKKGKLIRVTNYKITAWTITRTLNLSGSLFSVIKVRLIKDLKRIPEYFYKRGTPR
jgi:hypothetical protein